MSIVSNVIAETSLDFANPKLAEDVLAPLFAERINTVFPAFQEAKKMISGIMVAYRSLSAGGSVASVYGAAFAAVQAAAGFLEGRLDDKISKNYKKLEIARHLTVEKHIKPGDWATVVNAGGVAVGKLDMKNNVGGWDESQFLAQYAPGIVWMAEKTAAADILLPTWHSPHIQTDMALPIWERVRHTSQALESCQDFVRVIGPL